MEHTVVHDRDGPFRRRQVWHGHPPCGDRDRRRGGSAEMTERGTPDRDGLIPSRTGGGRKCNAVITSSSPEPAPAVLPRLGEAQA